MKEKKLNVDLEFLNIKSDIVAILKANDINTIEDLWQLKRKELKKLELSDSDINNIIIKLQLYGIDINRKIYNYD